MNYAGGADKKSAYSICVNLSMVLNVKIDNPAEFFGGVWVCFGAWSL
jgi:hypothetical protein